ncbi:MAG: hypothetical protein EZS28_015241 [Streblomastix strix]|uniref:RING-type domain-containing protein n=1 Tax=Streblomastix strix TaxID=222440 RepID=A0A5J4W3Z9_9EUKA|nr:MAG: hypothetical protein EZS28_015241 [Streblomastix strix]
MFANVGVGLSREQRLAKVDALQKRILEQQASKEVAADEILESITKRIAQRMKRDIDKEKFAENSSLKRQQNIEDEEEDLSDKVVQAIEGNICPICMDLMAPQDKNPMILVPCGHCFCKQCVPMIYQEINQRGRQNSSTPSRCPICRKNV